MSFNDLTSDMLTRIRNAVDNKAARVDCRNNKLCAGIAKVLKQEGYIGDYSVIDDDRQGILRIELRYGPHGEKLFNVLRRESKPSRRVYVGVKDLPRPLAGLGTAILTTPKGVMSDRQARAEQVGGELLCTLE